MVLVDDRSWLSWIWDVVLTWVLPKEEAEPLKKVSSILSIFANPSSHDLYGVALGALQNWSTVTEESQAGKDEVLRGNC